MSPSSRSSTMTAVHLLLGSVIWLALIPLLLLVTFPLVLLRLLHHFLAKFFRPDLIPLTNLVDNLLILKPSIDHAIGNCMQVWRVKGNLEINEFRNHFEKLFLSTPELQQSYKNLYCYFEKWGLYNFKRPVDSIDLKEQIKELEWDYERYENEADTSDEEQLDMFIGKWMSTSDYGHKPNWGILLIHLEKTKESILLFKLDHGLADGYTMVHLVDKLGGVQAPYVVKEQDFPLLTRIKLMLTFPALIILDYGIKFIRTKNIPLPNHTPSIKSLVDEEWMISFTTLDLNSVKKVRQMTKSHFNNVLGAIQVGALRRYCLETKDPSEFPEECWLPSPTGWPNHPAMTMGTMTNHMTVTAVSVPFKKDDPVQRVLGAEASYLYAVDTNFEISIQWIFLPLFWCAPPALNLITLEFMTAIGFFPGQQCLTPLMCSSQKHKLMGLPVERLGLPVHVPWFIRPSHIYIVPVSNSGRMDISVNGTKKVFKTQKDLDRFTKVYMKAELDSLLSAVANMKN